VILHTPIMNRNPLHLGAETVTIARRAHPPRLADVPRP
jgi:hypothetical protein